MDTFISVAYEAGTRHGMKRIPKDPEQLIDAKMKAKHRTDFTDFVFAHIMTASSGSSPCFGAAIDVIALITTAIITTNASTSTGTVAAVYRTTTSVAIGALSGGRGHAMCASRTQQLFFVKMSEATVGAIQFLVRNRITIATFSSSIPRCMPIMIYTINIQLLHSQTP